MSVVVRPPTQAWKRKRTPGAAYGARLALVVAALLYAVLMFIALTYRIWPITGALSVLVVLSAAWLFGRRGGILVACLVPPINIIILGVSAPVDWGYMLLTRGVPGTITLLAVGLAVGWLRTLTEALGASETRLRAQYQAFPLPTYTWQREGDAFILTDYNDALVACTRGDIAAQRGVRHRDHYRELPEIAAAIERCHVTGASVRQQLRQRLVANGEERDLILTHVPIPPDLVLLHLEDITERLRAERARRASEENLAAAQRIAHLGSWEYVSATGGLRWSDEVFRIAGYDPQAFVPTGERLLAAIHPDDHERAHHAMVIAHERGESYDVEYRFVRPDGAIRFVRQQAEVVYDADRRPSCWRGSLLDVTEQRALERQLAHQATHDPLTGLPNRALFLDRLGQALARSRRDGVPCAVLLLNLDRFKAINDAWGQCSGDRLLVAVADQLRRCLRETDTLARLGGDEFAVLAEGGAVAAEVAQLAARLRHTLEAQLIFEGRAHAVAASIGLAISTPEHPRPDDLLRDAANALYRAKGAGGADTVIFDPATHGRDLERLALERDLQGALERGEYAVQYQPIVALATGRIAEVEALVRWRHPVRGNVPPDSFIPLLEESGLIVPLGRWVLRQACRQARVWNEEQGHALTVAVNLSAREFQDAALAADVAQILAGAGLAPRRLRLEITERLAMRDAPATAATLADLHALGVQVALDDFGTGYSSLAYLKRFPVDALKIDRAFVAGLGVSAEDTAIVGATIGLARTLGLAVVAEGVETAEQATQLRTMGCTDAQGYYFARPLEAGAVGALLAMALPLFAPPPTEESPRCADAVAVGAAVPVLG